jgi:hypothetical protein
MVWQKGIVDFFYVFLVMHPFGYELSHPCRIDAFCRPPSLSKSIR